MTVALGPIHYTGFLPLAALALTLYALARSIKGLDSERYLRASSILIAAGWLVYWIPFVTLDFTLHEVFWNTSPGLPLWMRLASAWAGGGGSLFLFTLIAALASLYLAKGGGRWVTAGLSSIIVVGLVAAFLNDAFTVLPETPISGAGLNPLLKSPWLYPHPLTTFSGYALLATSLAVMVLGGDHRRSYIVYEVGWALLTLGILFGGYWSYETFGWGGYWAWDPVETGELMVWLAATLLPHLAVVAPSLQRTSAALTVSSVFLAMYVTRTGLSPLHSFAAPSVGSLILLATSVSWLAASAVMLYRSIEDGWREIVKTAKRVEMYTTGVLIAAVALAVSTLFVYNTLLVPSLLTAAGIDASVPQMADGVRYFHPVLYPLLIIMLAALPAVFTGRWLGWRGYLALLVANLIVSSVAAISVYNGALVLAPLSPLETNTMMAFGLPWASTALVSSAAYMVLAGRRGIRRLLADRLAGLSILHLGLALTAVGVLLSGTYAFNEAYMAEYTVKPGETVTVQEGVSLVFESYSMGVSNSTVDIFTNYVYRGTSYFYGQVALLTLSQDLSRIVNSYELARKVLTANGTVRLAYELTTTGELFVPGTFKVEGKATIRYVNIASNATVLLTSNEPVTIELTNITLRPTLSIDPSRGVYYLFTPLQASTIRILLPRNVSSFMPPTLSIHDILEISFSEPATLVLGNVTLEISNATILSEQLLTGGKGSPITVNGSIMEGRFAVLDPHAAVVEAKGYRLRVPYMLPDSLVVYMVVEDSEEYERLFSLLRDSGLYDLLLNTTGILKLAFSDECIKTVHTLALETTPRSCQGYVRAPKSVPETAWMDIRLRIDTGGWSRDVTVRIRFEAYGEVQGIHGLVPKVVRIPVGIDEVYIVLEPPTVDSIVFGRSIAYHELLVYYLHEAFKNLNPWERLALSALMAAGYQHDFIRSLSPEQARTLLEGSTVDLYILASKFNPSNSTVDSQGITVRVKIVPGVLLVWLGPTVMALSALYLALASVIKRWPSRR